MQVNFILAFRLLVEFTLLRLLLMVVTVGNLLLELYDILCVGGGGGEVVTRLVFVVTVIAL